MELLIPGLILVALMVYASTRIKRTAAAAFEAETVETDEFIMQKPAGFLHVIGGDAKYAFETYSKDFGASGADDTRRATATLRIDRDRTVDHVLADRMPKEATVIDDITEIIDEVRYRVVETEWSENEIEFSGIHKLAEHGGKVYDLEARMLRDTTGETAAGIETIVDSFRVK